MEVRFNRVVHFFFVFILSNFLLTSDAHDENTIEPKVTIPQGTLQGTILKTHHDRSISAFMGIPFAQPPIGNLRFANPVAASGWNGTRYAITDANMCPQILGNTFKGDEDCLYLNVYTPKLPRSTSPTLLPVMVFIYGGAFCKGSSISSSYGPGYILDEDVILVTFNYRIGPLGFLSTGDEVASGNWGLKDQVLALKWVRDNIEYFSGDPDKVTIFGESAGASSVHLLTLSNATIGLFHRYITQSGSALGSWVHRPRAAYAKRAFELGKHLGCLQNTSDHLISCLRTFSASDIIATESRFFVWYRYPDVVWGPTDEPDIEGAILTDSPTNLFNNRRIRDLPWMSGINRDEGLYVTSEFYHEQGIFENFIENFDFLLPIILSYTHKSDAGVSWMNAVKSYYFNNDLELSKNLLLTNLTIAVGDSHFFWPTYDALKQHFALAVKPQYLYTFNYRGTYSKTILWTGSTVNYGVSHGDELLYLFPSNHKFSPYTNETMSKADYEMVDIMVKLWTSFAANGSLTVSDLDNTTTWEPYSTADNYLQIGDGPDTKLKVQNSFGEQRMQFWDGLK